MDPFIRHTGRVAVLDRQNVDTDQIIPKQFLKRIERTGFGQYLFYDWRFDASGEPNPNFELNAPAAQGATILLTGRNFGCGSSREHAVWALQDYGFRAILAPSFADIFHTNCLKNGLLPVVLPEEQIRALMARAKNEPGYLLTVDLEMCSVSDTTGFSASFTIDPFQRHCLLNGLDDIALTLQHAMQIAAFEQKRAVHYPATTMLND
jgi:3-isopropylmalate/(R)-2-methylmalate dehydratase small subunit